MHLVAVAPLPDAAVYNLTVADQPEYFANGVLVHNCSYDLCALQILRESVRKAGKAVFAQATVKGW